jgi:hypothetical protein
MILMIEFVCIGSAFTAARELYFLELDGLGTAKSSAFRLSATEVAFLHIAVTHIPDGTERTGNGAHLATDTFLFIHQHHIGPVCLTCGYGTGGTNCSAKGLVTLGAHHGKVKCILGIYAYLDIRLGRVELIMVFV